MLILLNAPSYYKEVNLILSIDFYIQTSSYSNAKFIMHLGSMALALFFILKMDIKI